MHGTGQRYPCFSLFQRQCVPGDRALVVGDDAVPRGDEQLVADPAGQYVDGPMPVVDPEAADLTGAQPGQIGHRLPGRAVQVTQQRVGGDDGGGGEIAARAEVFREGERVARPREVEAALKERRRAWEVTISRGGQSVTSVFPG